MAVTVGQLSNLFDEVEKRNFDRDHGLWLEEMWTLEGFYTGESREDSTYDIKDQPLKIRDVWWFFIDSLRA